MKSVLTPQKNKLLILGETMRCRKVRRILCYHVPNKRLSREIFAHHLLLFFYPFRDEKELLPGFPPTYWEENKTFNNFQLYATYFTKWWNCRKYKFFKLKGKGSLQCDSYMGNYMVHNGLNIEPIYIFVSGKGGTGKFIWWK